MTRRGEVVRFELYYQLRSRGLSVWVDHKVTARSEHSRAAYFTPDLAVIQAGKHGAHAVAVIRAGGQPTRQRDIENYARAGVPAFWADLVNLSEIADAIAAGDLTKIDAYRIVEEAKREGEGVECRS